MQDAAACHNQQDSNCRPKSSMALKSFRAGFLGADRTSQRTEKSAHGTLSMSYGSKESTVSLQLCTPIGCRQKSYLAHRYTQARAPSSAPTSGTSSRRTKATPTMRRGATEALPGPF